MSAHGLLKAELRKMNPCVHAYCLRISSMLKSKPIFKVRKERGCALD